MSDAGERIAWARDTAVSEEHDYEEHGSYRLTKVLADVGDAVRALEDQGEPSTAQLLAIVSLQQEALFHLGLHFGDIQSSEP